MVGLEMLEVLPKPNKLISLLFLWEKEFEISIIFWTNQFLGTGGSSQRFRGHWSTEGVKVS